MKKETNNEKEVMNKKIKAEKPTVPEINLTVNQEILNVLGRVCDVALKANGLIIMNDVNTLLRWAQVATITNPIKE